MSYLDFEGTSTASKTGLSELYDAYFKTRFQFDPRRDLVWKEVVRWIQRHYIAPGSRVLDLGAGYCNFINQVEARDKHAVDVFTEFPQYAAPGVNTHVGTCTDMHFLEDDSIDVAFASNLAEHLARADLILLLHELRRVLRLDGTLILMQPNFKYCSTTYFDDYTHVQIFTDASLLDFLEAYGFGVIHCFPRFMPVNMKSTLRLRLPMLPQVVRMYLAMPFKPFAGQMLMVSRNRKRGPAG
ncbi:MAG: methyltransferase domain-containing protein [Gemmatimonadaceae bacterium]